MNLGKMLIFAAILVGIAIGIISINSAMIQLTNETAIYSAGIERLSIVNASDATRDLIENTSEAVTKTSVSGQSADALANPIGAFIAAIEMFTRMPDIIMGFVGDVDSIIDLPDWLVGINGIIFAVLMVLLIGGVLTLIFKVNIFR